MSAPRTLAEMRAESLKAWAAQVENARGIAQTSTACSMAVAETLIGMLGPLYRRNVALMSTWPSVESWAEARRAFDEDTMRTASRIAAQIADACSKAAGQCEQRAASDAAPVPAEADKAG